MSIQLRLYVIQTRLIHQKPVLIQPNQLQNPSATPATRTSSFGALIFSFRLNIRSFWMF